MKHIINIYLGLELVSVFQFEENEEFMLYDLINNNINDIVKQYYPAFDIKNDYVSYYFTHNDKFVNDKRKLKATCDNEFDLHIDVTEDNGGSTIERLGERDYFAIAFLSEAHAELYIPDWVDHIVRLEYSYDKRTWYSVPIEDQYALNHNMIGGVANQKIYFRGENPEGLGFTLLHNESDNFNIYGDITTLLDYKHGVDTIPVAGFSILFKDSNIRHNYANAERIRYIKENGCAGMFQNCFGLYEILEMPNLKRVDFDGCAYMYSMNGTLNYNINKVSLYCEKFTADSFLGMFYQIPNIIEITTNITHWTDYDEYGSPLYEAFSYWLFGVTEDPLRKFKCPSELPDERGVNRIPNNWIKEDL